MVTGAGPTAPVADGGYLSCLLLFLMAGPAMAGECHPKYQIVAGHTACMDSSPNAEVMELTDEDKQGIVDLHNLLRANVTPPATMMMKMSWDDELARLAQKWSEACDEREKGALVHDPERNIPGRFSVGQNIGDSLTWRNEVLFWYNEHKDYEYGVLHDAQGAGFGAVAHYTQFAWGESYKIGCGGSVCYDQPMFVCNYARKGNTTPFEKPYRNGTRCSECKVCDMDGLCDCGDLECDVGEIDSATCTCTCDQTGGSVPDFLDNPTCSMNCSDGKVDTWFCGNVAWCQPSNCDSFLDECPFMCNVCPFADLTYVWTPGAEESSASPTLPLVVMVMATTLISLLLW